MIGLEFAQHFVDQRLVLHNLKVGIENAARPSHRSPLRSAATSEHLHPRLAEPCARSARSHRDVRSVDLVFHHVVRLDREDVNRVRARSRGMRARLDNAFPLDRDRRSFRCKNNRSVNYSSLKRDWINSSMS